MSKWAEIRNDHSEEIANGFKVYIDAWKTADDNEQGTVIAEVIGIVENGKINISINYRNNDAKNDEYAQEKINEAIDDLKEELSA